MNTPTEQELTELNEFIHLHVMNFDTLVVDDVPKYSTDPAAAMEVLKKCQESGSIVMLAKRNAGWRASTHNGYHLTFSDTQELCIALFAKKLYTQQP